MVLDMKCHCTTRFNVLHGSWLDIKCHCTTCFIVLALFLIALFLLCQILADSQVQQISFCRMLTEVSRIYPAIDSKFLFLSCFLTF